MINRITDNQFKLVSKYQPSGDQPQAIEQLVDNIEGGEKAQILMGATGTGQTYTMSQVISKVNKPTLVIAHNKTLAGQLYGEFKEFFPENAVEYFVSYYDYYQPEAYVPSSDTYIEKDSSVNDEIDKLRHSATSALLERNDVIIVASVSCIYGLGSPKEYADSVVSLRPGLEISRDKLLNDLVDIQFERNDQGWLINLRNHLTHGIGFPCTSSTHQDLSLFSTLDVIYQLFNCLRLVPGGLVFRYEFKFVVYNSIYHNSLIHIFYPSILP